MHNLASQRLARAVNCSAQHRPFVADLRCIELSLQLAILTVLVSESLTVRCHASSVAVGPYAFGDRACPGACRQQRLRELREASTRPTTGTLELIRSSEFREKVTNASKDCWVVVLLFKSECAPICAVTAVGGFHHVLCGGTHRAA